MLFEQGILYLVGPLSKKINMRTLIVYATMHGFTGLISKKMSEHLGDEVILVNLYKNKHPQLSGIDRVIIGGSIHAGRIQKRIKEFCERHSDELREKELGLFICCAEDVKIAAWQRMNAFPEELLVVAKSTAVFRRGFDSERMNFFDNMVVRRITGIKKNTAKVDFEAVRQFSRRMDRIFNPFLYLT